MGTGDNRLKYRDDYRDMIARSERREKKGGE